MLDEVIQAIKAGELRKAQKQLTKLIKEDKTNPQYWLWMSYVVDNRTEKIYTLRMAKKLAPNDPKIATALAILGEGREDGERKIYQQQRRNWEDDLLLDALPSQTRFQAFMSNPVTRMIGIIGASVIVIGLIIMGIVGFGSSMLFPRLTITPIAWTETPTFTLTVTPRFRTPTPTPATAIPLIELLESTYTPVPLYVNTPHPRIESYRAALNAYHQQNYDRMLTFMEQAVREEPDSVDIHYYTGLAYLLNEDYDNARSFFQQAININDEFSPAYYGMALVRRSTNPDSNIVSDLESALEFDPQYRDVILTLAEYYYDIKDTNQAFQILLDNREALQDLSRYHLLLAKTYIDKGQNLEALESAIEANQRDLTSLEGYLVLSQAYMINGEIPDAEELINFYFLYDDENPLAWAVLARVHYLMEGDLEGALERFSEAEEFDDENAYIHLYRGISSLEDGEYQSSLNDLFVAKNLLPHSFTANLEFARALYFLERYNEAYNQLNVAEMITNTPLDEASVYFWRASTLDQMGQTAEANQDWSQILLLSETVELPAEWIETADLRLNPPTITPSLTNTSTPTLTATNTNTPTPSRTPTATNTSTLTPSATNTVTPTATQTMTPSPSITNTGSPTSTVEE